MKTKVGFFFLLLVVILIFSFNATIETTKTKPLNISDSLISDTFKIFTLKSLLPNEYKNFNSPNAINRIAEIENEYFNEYPNGFSQYFGTQWMKKRELAGDSIVIHEYISKLKEKESSPFPLHCTHYAVEALKAGLDSNFYRLDTYHKEIWGNREYAGWSLGYLLTKHFGWKAYLILDESSSEYNYCVKNYAKDQKYHVWYQPNIPVERLFDIKKDRNAIDSLLLNHEFGWGFSNQGWHTWITRFDTLKECYWDGIPSRKYNPSDEVKPLFLKTKFVDYQDYKSHIIVFPPKKD